VEVLRQQAQHGAHIWVFPRADGHKPVLIDYAWRRACARAGLVDFHFHDLRHTSASYLAMSGASIRDIAEILGHTRLKQTMKYIHLMEPHTRGVLERMAHMFLETDRRDERAPRSRRRPRPRAGQWIPPHTGRVVPAWWCGVGRGGGNVFGGRCGWRRRQGV